MADASTEFSVGGPEWAWHRSAGEDAVYAALEAFFRRHEAPVPASSPIARWMDTVHPKSHDAFRVMIESSSQELRDRTAHDVIESVRLAWAASVLLEQPSSRLIVDRAFITDKLFAADDLRAPADFRMPQETPVMYLAARLLDANPDAFVHIHSDQSAGVDLTLEHGGGRALVELKERAYWISRRRRTAGHLASDLRGKIRLAAEGLTLATNPPAAADGEFVRPPRVGGRVAFVTSSPLTEVGRDLTRSLAAVMSRVQRELLSNGKPESALHGMLLVCRAHNFSERGFESAQVGNFIPFPLLDMDENDKLWRLAVPAFHAAFPKAGAVPKVIA